MQVISHHIKVNQNYSLIYCSIVPIDPYWYRREDTYPDTPDRLYGGANKRKKSTGGNTKTKYSRVKNRSTSPKSNLSAVPSKKDAAVIVPGTTSTESLAAGPLEKTKARPARKFSSAEEPSQDLLTSSESSANFVSDQEAVLVTLLTPRDSSKVSQRPPHLPSPHSFHYRQHAS